MRNSRITSRLCGLLACLLLVGGAFAAYPYKDASAEPDNDTHAEGAYVYPILSGTQEWIDLGSTPARRAACQVPEELLSEMSTPALLKTAEDYPFLIDFWAFDRPEWGAEHVVNISNAWQALLEREDLQQAVDAYPVPASDTDGEHDYSTTLSIIKIMRPEIELPEGVSGCTKPFWEENEPA